MTLKKINILTWNFQDMIHVVHNIKDDSALHVPCQESSISSKYHDLGLPLLETIMINNLSWYIPLSQTRLFMTSRMIQSPESLFRNPQSTISNHIKDPTILYILLIKILTQNFQSIFLGGKIRLSSKSLVWNPKCQPITTFKEPSPLRAILGYILTKTVGVFSLGWNKIIHEI